MIAEKRKPKDHPNTDFTPAMQVICADNYSYDTRDTPARQTHESRETHLRGSRAAPTHLPTPSTYVAPMPHSIASTRPTMHSTHVFYFLCSNVHTPHDTSLFTISQPVNGNRAHGFRYFSDSNRPFAANDHVVQNPPC